jgi:hypothetical protein
MTPTPGIGTWDTHSCEVPADTPDDMLERIVRELDSMFPYSGGRPLAVGIFPPEKEEANKELCRDCAGTGIRLDANTCLFRAPEDWHVVSLCERCQIYDDEEGVGRLLSGQDSLVVLCRDEHFHRIIKPYAHLEDCINEEGSREGLATWLERRAVTHANKTD